MTPETLDDVKRAALAIYAIAERMTIAGPQACDNVEAGKLIGQAANAILGAVQGARGDAGEGDSQERICIDKRLPG